jgi:outer membrane immunogenic protein
LVVAEICKCTLGDGNRHFRDFEMKTKISLAMAALLALSELAFAQLSPSPVTGLNSASASSWMAGAQAGYNWQSGSVVYGLEADISGTGLKDTMTTTLQSGYVPPPTAITTSSVDWYGTVRGRLGWATGPLMVYGTGGLAYGRTAVNSTLNNNLFLITLNSQSSSVKAGWVAGFGIEYLLRPNLIANLGYQYVDLGSTNLAASSPDGTLYQGVHARGQFQVVSAGLSWLFTPAGSAIVDGPKYAKAPYAKAPYAKAPVVTASPWQGLYVGGHAGGAWGNGTDAVYSDSNVVRSDVRLKRDIVLVGRRDDGLGLYSYRYLWSDTVYVGVMAQEVALIHPSAVVRDPLTGYLGVNYARLGLHLMTLTE